MYKLIFSTGKLAIISVFIMIIVPANLCFADVIPTDHESVASSMQIRKKQVIFSDDLVLLMDECNPKTPLQNKKEHCKTQLQSNLVESRELQQQITAKLDETKEKEVKAQLENQKAKEEYYKNLKKLPANSKNNSYRYREPRAVDYSAETGYLQQALKEVLEDERKIIDALELLGIKEKSSNINQHKKGSLVLSAYKLPLLGLLIFICSILIRRSIKFSSRV